MRRNPVVPHADFALFKLCLTIISLEIIYTNYLDFEGLSISIRLIKNYFYSSASTLKMQLQ